MLKKLNDTRKGFTIIEVLIVLAIAGLILLIVFLAVPALQRNSRNTQVKNAAAGILGAVSEFSNNNNGQLPTAVNIQDDGTVEVKGSSASTSPSQAKVQGGYVATVGTAMPQETGKFVVNLKHKCDGNQFATDVTPRAVSIGYLIENGGKSTASQCTEN